MFEEGSVNLCSCFLFLLEINEEMKLIRTLNRTVNAAVQSNRCVRVQSLINRKLKNILIHEFMSYCHLVASQ